MRVVLMTLLVVGVAVACAGCGDNQITGFGPTPTPSVQATPAEWGRAGARLRHPSIESFPSRIGAGVPACALIKASHIVLAVGA